jgi:hypothetical protein
MGRKLSEPSARLPAHTNPRHGDIVRQPCKCRGLLGGSGRVDINSTDNSVKSFAGNTGRYTFPMTRMRLTFVLPQLYDHPIGGYKVNYQYANALAARGHDVTLVHPITSQDRPALLDHVFLRAAKVRQATTKKPPISWFAFDPNIRSVLIPAL